MSDKKASTTVQKKSNNTTSLNSFLNDLSLFFTNYKLTYVDVGAFDGEFFDVVSAYKGLDVREAHLIEPNPNSYALLEERIKSIKIQSLHTYNFAIGRGKCEKTYNMAKSMTKRLDMDLQSSNTFRTEEKSLDELSSIFTDGIVHLLKIDVEGREMDVLRSASNLLTDQKIHVIYIEVGFNKSATQQTYFGKIDAFLQDYGYRVFKIYDQTKEWISDNPLLRRCNVAYMSKNFAKANPYQLTVENIALRKKIKELEFLLAEKQTNT